MQARLDYAKTAPDGFKAMLGLEQYARHSGLEPALLELVKMRASQINGCAFCLDMHSKDARAAGETEQRLYALNAWRETPFFSERERAALAWTETVTRVSETHVPDEVYETSANISLKKNWSISLSPSWRSTAGIVSPFPSGPCLARINRPSTERHRAG